MAKFSVSYSRKVQTKQYENMTIFLTEEFDTDEVSQDYAFSQVRATVERWITEELKAMGVKG